MRVLFDIEYPGGVKRIFRCFIVIFSNLMSFNGVKFRVNSFDPEK